MSEPTYLGSESLTRAAERYAAELLDKTGVPLSYDHAVTVVAIAWLEGGRRELAFARDALRGDPHEVQR